MMSQRLAWLTRPKCPEMSGFVRFFRPDRSYNRKHLQHNDLPPKYLPPRPDIRRKFPPPDFASALVISFALNQRTPQFSRL